MERFFSKNLYAYKMAYRLDNSDLAELLKTTKVSIGRWIIEGAPVKPHMLHFIAEKLEVSEEDLMYKDLALHFLKRSGFLKMDTSMAADTGPDYGDSIQKSKVLLQFQSIQDSINRLMQTTEKAVLELKQA